MKKKRLLKIMNQILDKDNIIKNNKNEINLLIKQVSKNKDSIKKIYKNDKNENEIRIIKIIVKYFIKIKYTI